MILSTIQNKPKKNIKIPFTLKGELISFGDMCKAIAHSNQNRLLYLSAKLQGLKTNRTRATNNSKQEIAVCDVGVRHQQMIYI